MLTLSYGYKLPQAGDRGAPLFQALEDNITRLNGHTHNGTDSAPLTAQAVVAVTGNILSAGWVFYADGLYRQLVTIAPGFDYDKVQIGFRLTTGQFVYPAVDKVSATQYYVYTNDNTQDFVALYGG